VALVEEHEVEGGEGDDDDENDKENEVGDQAAAVERLLSCGVEVRADYVARGLANEEDGRCSLLFCFACGVLGGPGVDEGGDAGVERDLRWMSAWTRMHLV
jgi:hypothetical protein